MLCRLGNFTKEVEFGHLVIEQQAGARSWKFNTVADVVARLKSRPFNNQQFIMY